MTLPLITIGLTTYNAVDTIERALHSAFAQTWRPVEIVAVDDCSDDETLDILFRLSKQYDELRVYSNPVNSGVAVSRNRILKEARGELVVFFDDDDESLPERIAEQYKRITSYETIFAEGKPVICHAARRQVYPHGEERIEGTMGQIEARRAPSGLDVARRILLGAPLVDGYGACPTCSQMARLSTYRMLGGFDSTFRRSEDTDFNIRLAKAGGHFVGISYPLVVQNMTKTSEKNLSEEYRYTVLLMEKHRTLMEQEGQYIFCRRWFDFKQAWLERRYGGFMLSLSLLAITSPWLTVRRLICAFQNYGLNQTFRHFHMKTTKTVKD